MSELIKKEEGQLINLFRERDGIKPILEEIKAYCESFVFDCTTKDGRKEARSLARKVSSSKTLLERVGKESIAPLKEQVEIADRQRIDASKFLDNLRDQIKFEAEEWERKEKERVEKIKSTIKKAHEACSLIFISIDDAEKKLIEISQYASFDFEEMKDEASIFFNQAKENINKEIERLKKEEKEKEELDQLRKEKEEREEKERQELIEKERLEREEKIRKEAEEKAKIDAENKARAEKERLEKEAQESLKREQEAKERAERAEREFEEAKKRAEIEAQQAKEREEKAREEAREAEQRKIAQEEERKKQEQQKREADIEHRKKINNEALFDLMKNANIVESEARLIITSIAKGQIKNLFIRY